MYKLWILSQNKKCKNTLIDFYNKLTSSLEDSNFKEIEEILLERITDTEGSLFRDDFYNLIENIQEDKKGSILSPHVSSYATILAKINKKYKISNIYHDKNSDMEKVLNKYLNYMTEKEILYNENWVYNYFIKNTIKNSFIDSKSSPIIQLADLFSGVFMRFFLSLENNNNTDILKKYIPIMRLLFDDGFLNLIISLPNFKKFKIFLYSGIIFEFS